MPFLRRTSRLLLIPALFFSCIVSHATPSIDQQLREGKLQEAAQTLTTHLTAQPKDDLARFQLGTIQLLLAGESLSQEGASYGTLSNTLNLPFVRIGAGRGKNPNPKLVTYEDLRRMIARFQASVAKAEATLAPIEDKNLYWSLNLREVALDLNGDGAHIGRENLDTLFRQLSRQWQKKKEPLVLGLDSADVYWLRGYCHVLQALADMTLAYDHQKLFDNTAHLFFPNLQTSYYQQRNNTRPLSKPNLTGWWGGWESLLDAVAAIHLMDFPLREPQRMQSAREHLLHVIALSHGNIMFALQEKDNRNELIPNPDQTSVIPNMVMNLERIEAWDKFLEEAEDILNGEKLVPFWRSGFEQGVNLRRVFEQPRDFDLVLWTQGTAALPYLEEGDQTNVSFWRELQRLFQGRFLGFALWVN